MPRYSYSLSQPVAQQIEERASALQVPLSSVVEADLTAYWSLLRWGLLQASQTLTRAEVLLIFDALTLNSVWLLSRSPEIEAATWVQPSRLLMEIGDACAVQKLDAKWRVDRDALLAKLQSMDGIVRLALVDWVSTMWANADEEHWERELARFPMAHGTCTHAAGAAHPI